MHAQVNPQFYAFRWITLLLTQEFPFPDTVRIWDTLFSDPNGRSNCLLRLCVAMLLNVREQLLEVLSKTVSCVLPKLVKLGKGTWRRGM